MAEELHGVCGALELTTAVQRAMAQIPAGRVRVSQRGTSRFIWFGNGHVFNITSSLEDERLGSWLVARGLIARGAMRDVLVRKPKEELFGAALVRTGLIRPERLHEELVALSLQIAGRMLLEEAVWEADGASSVAADATNLDLPPDALFLVAARRVADQGQLSRLAGGGRRWVSNGGAGVTGIELDPLERLVLGQLASPRTAAEVQAAVPPGTADISRTLAVLAAAGLVRSLAPAAESARSAAAPAPMYPPASPRLRERLLQLEAAQSRSGVAGSNPEEEAARAEDDKRHARELLNGAGDPRSAYKLLAHAVEVAPDADSLVLIAELEIANPLWRQRALEHLKKAVALDPRHTQAWLALANYWSLRGQPEKQRRCLEKILTYNPANEDVRKTLEILSKPD